MDSAALQSMNSVVIILSHPQGMVTLDLDFISKDHTPLKIPPLVPLVSRSRVTCNAFERGHDIIITCVDSCLDLDHYKLFQRY